MDPARILLPLAAAILLALSLPAATGQPSLTLEIHAQGDDCPDGEAFCFTVQRGSLEALEPGTEVTIALENRDSSMHNLYVAPLEDANPNRDTDPDHALAGTRDLPEGGQDRITLTAPEDAQGLYLWCEIGAHERLGMILNAPYDPDEWEPPEPQNAPASAGALLLAALLSGSLAARTRRA